MRNLVQLILAFALIIQVAGCKKEIKPVDKMDWWKEAKFGMFIHWGLYSIPAGNWKDQQTKVGDGTEWIQSLLKIPVADYKPLAESFNPTQFNAEDYVLLAKEAGMKYIVLTSKHHDGFAMFKSSDPFNIVDATPYKKDVVKALAEACKKHGIHFGLYYSQAQDWNHPGGSACSGLWDPAQEGSFDKYLDEVAVPQVEEILSNYNPEILWWDTPCEMTLERAAKFAPILAKYPNLIVNNRLCNGIAGDLDTPEQHIPATGIPGKNWESCMTMNGTWGYSVNDHNWKSSETLVRNLIDIVSKGGNYLLNVGPTSAGLIPEPSIERLKEVGAWIKNNGEALYGTTASPFDQLDWGRCTVKKAGRKNRLYLHVFDMPSDGKLLVPGLASSIKKAYALNNRNENLKTAKEGNNILVDLSGVKSDKFATVIVLETSDEVVVYKGPQIKADYSIFIDQATFTISTDIPNAVVRYTIDGSVPTIESKPNEEINTVSANASFVLKTICFVDGKAISGLVEKSFTKAKPTEAVNANKTTPGLRYNYYEGKWTLLPNFSALKSIDSGVNKTIELAMKKRNENYGVVFTGYLQVPETGVYQFTLTSDDGSRMIISGNTLLNDGLHGMEDTMMDVALSKGLHPIEIQFFQNVGGDGLELKWKISEKPSVSIPTENLVH
jgi:alpha-L-fucosidase